MFAALEQATELRGRAVREMIDIPGQQRVDRGHGDVDVGASPYVCDRALLERPFELELAFLCTHRERFAVCRVGAVLDVLRRACLYRGRCWMRCLVCHS